MVLYGPLVKRLRQRPLTPLTSVRFRYGSPYAPLAQLVEQLTLNQWAQGSSPWRCTNKKTQDRKILRLFFLRKRDCISLAHFPDFRGYPCILCTARFSLAQKENFQANSSRTASRITGPVMFVASGLLFSSGLLADIRPDQILHHCILDAGADNILKCGYPF